MTKRTDGKVPILEEHCCNSTSTSLRIGIVLSNFEKSGVTSNTVDLCEGLKRIGHDVTLIVGKPAENFQFARSEYLKAKGVRLIYIPNVKGSGFSKLRAFMGIVKTLTKESFDILHFESIYLTFIAKLLRKKFVLTYHSFGLKKNVFSQHASRLISISDGITEDAIKRHGYQEEEIDVVLHGVNERFAETYSIESQRAIRYQLNIPTDKIIIGIVASIEPRKGHHFLLEAVSLLPENLRNKIHIVFCGNYKGEGSERWIKEKISDYSLDKLVTLLGFQDPLKVYQALDIFCLPSVWEGFPLTAIEAMMAGCCVIRSNVQGCKEQIIEGETGFSFISENSHDLSRLLEKILSNPYLIQDTAARAREYALKNFSLNVMARNTVEVYLKTIGNRKEV